MNSSISKRFDKALENARTIVGEIVHIETLAGGINNLVAVTKSNEGRKAVIKIYKNQKPNDGITRLTRERDMIYHLKGQGIEKQANIIEYNKEYQFTIFDYIEGSKIKKLKLYDIKEIAEFIVILNTIGQKKKKEVIDFKDAAEPLRNFKQFRKGIMNRLEELVKETSSKKNLSLVNEWLETEVMPRAYAIEREAMKHEDMSIWKDKKVGNYISPSDIGIHNMIKTQDCIKFIDFEYAGKDDISKLLVDLSYQPENIFSNKEEDYLINYVISLIENGDATIRERCEMIKPLVGLKWISIILKIEKGNKLDERRIKKAMDYYSKLNCLIN